MDRGAWQATVHGVTKSQKQLITHAWSVSISLFITTKKSGAPGSHSALLSRVEAGNPGFPRLVQVTSGGFSWWL